MATSETRKHSMPYWCTVNARSGRTTGGGTSARAMETSIVVSAERILVCYSYCQSGSSGCFRSQSGRRLCTVGTAAKLYDGGGEVVAHSSVQASHGLSPAGLPLRRDTIRFHTKIA